MVKNLGLVLKRCEYDLRSTKKNLGSIGGSLEEPQPKHVHWGSAQRFAHCIKFPRQFADLNKITHLGNFRTTGVTDDQNLLKIVNFWV